MAVRPVNDRILVKPQKPETRTSSGFVIPDAAQEKLPRGTIVDVGKGRKLDDGTYVKMEVNVGDVIMYVQSEAQPIRVNGVDYVVLKEEHILCVINEE